MMKNLAFLTSFLPLTHSARAESSQASSTDSFNFITRPDLKPPRLNITIYNSSALAPGHLFLAPYVNLYQERWAKGHSQPCRIGPTIYDGKTGDLIWSGACLLENTNTCDFRPYKKGSEGEEEYGLSAILCNYSPGGPRRGVLIDNTYNITRYLDVGDGEHFNGHELLSLDNGTRALHLLDRSIQKPLAHGGKRNRWILDNGFRELDLATGDVTFEWWASDHVPLNESTIPIRGWEQKKPGWDWFHANSIAKNEGGDYLLSARFTDTVYKISGYDGRILWRLGGRHSTFTMLDDLNFSRQHDARFLSFPHRHHTHQTPNTSNNNVETLSLLNIAASDSDATSPSSSGIIVSLDTNTTTIAHSARLLQKFPRPDGGLTRLRGNLQYLPPNGNWLAVWSAGGYLTEFSPTGNMVMEARFAAAAAAGEEEEEKFVTYRAYKTPWVGRPGGGEKPVISATKGSVYWISWNGDTEVEGWRVYAADAADAAAAAVGDDDEVEGALVCSARRTGFETMCVSDDDDAGGGTTRERVFVRGVDGVGRVLGESEEVNV